jgi:hypothetical protein
VTQVVINQPVSLVPSNVLNVTLNHITVQFVLVIDLVLLFALVHLVTMILVLLIAQLVPLNVLLVKVMLITVLFVPKEDITHQVVHAQMVNISMETDVLIVLHNVKPVLLMISVTNVLTLLETKLQSVTVELDSMKTDKKNVHLVLKNVKSVT